MSFTQKVDVLDFVITVLVEHEKELDRLIQRLEPKVRNENGI